MSVKKTKKLALVTGATKGIGLATTKQLLSEEWNVVGIGRDFSVSLPSSFIPYPLDLSDLSSLPDKLKVLQTAYPDVDAIVCCAGKGTFGSLEELSFAQMRSLLDVNFLANAYLLKAFLPIFKKRNRGDVILLGSEAALQGKRMGSMYCASKFALRGFTQALREECATSNIRITLINPGMVQTEVFTNLSYMPGDDPLEHLLPEDIAVVISSILEARQGAVFDEINLSPQKKRIIKK